MSGHTTSGRVGAGAAEHPLAPSSHFAKDKKSVGALHAERLFATLGTEKPRAEVGRLLRHYVQAAKAPVVGALQITCSDEAERECVDAFQRDFVHFLLPTPKFSGRSPFRSANLGARYEWGAARITEVHFALKGGAPWKAILVKINSHVSVDETPAGPRFGRMLRFDEEDVFCGAIHATLGGTSAPFVDDLCVALQAEGLDRLALLRDEKAVDPALRTLYAAAVSVRLQARRAMIDIQDHVPRTPTLYFVVPYVSLNRRGHDTEILCGMYYSDRRGAEPHDEYCGLGDDPRDYELRREGAEWTLRDPHLFVPRPARNHRRIVREAWERTVETGTVHPRLGAGMQEIATRHNPLHAPHAKFALQALLALLCEVTPISAAMLLFGEGWIHLRHTAQAHRLVTEAAGDRAALAMLHDIEAQVERMEPEEAQHLCALLLDAYS